ncbi:hypothetical protein BKK79_24775 [Cupriavidus sp. USMAA2-4]|uniref:DUF1840 domain-containing protein n=1 Tax=Cupriavidus malaysiensis TaxID=367825 RepID=A0ABN4TZF0_9BURK|nr:MULTISPECIES: DUF1840 domain-containing protein [Cupriavidus]AOY95041.1 hypothetical protein BKK79_24775 [Cupriavidus sp. USMAA2-4]AOZ02065.1 hypothetical protein BKK81_22315 [Cupriavidus sp. USMAHM13]AOZ10546.1 hypothetical protein BKK80_33895 [Cupriavidus malaysiensis]
MLLTLHSKAAPDITLPRDLAQYLLGLVGKRIGERGVIRPDELPGAIERLESALGHGGEAPLADARRSAVLSRRAYPFLDMLRAARRQQADILWGI